MRDNVDFARGRLRYNSGNKKRLDDMWTAISISLNATGNGPQKQAKEWQKTWRDWKSNVLKKCTQNKSYAGGTGGGPPKVLKLTELEENLLEIIGPEAAGLGDIPEGGNFNRIKQKEFVPINDTIPKRRSFCTYESCETIAQEHYSNLSNPVQIKRELESDNISYHDIDNDDIDDIVLENNNVNTVIDSQDIYECSQAQSKGTNSKIQNSKENNSSAAVQLMRQNLEIKQERLRICKEKLLLQKETFEYLKNIHSDYKTTLTNIDYNIMRLREEIEKMSPSYLI